MIVQGTDGPSRASADRILRSSVEESRLALGAVLFTPVLGAWLVKAAGLPPHTAYQHHDDLGMSEYHKIDRQWTIWTPSPEVGRQAISTFLDYWVEHPDGTGGIFAIPRVFQRQWGHVTKYFTEIGIFDPRLLPWGAAYDSLIPFIVLVCFPHHRELPGRDGVEPTPLPKGL
jgi:hypothetical protein